jgi:hypothetical protein
MSWAFKRVTKIIITMYESHLFEWYILDETYVLGSVKSFVLNIKYGKRIGILKILQEAK